jgi:hypothetical protein
MSQRPMAVEHLARFSETGTAATVPSESSRVRSGEGYSNADLGERDLRAMTISAISNMPE